ncbi:MAG: proton-conducting transporter membrane subunit [Anaerolineae bacterium]
MNGEIWVVLPLLWLGMGAFIIYLVARLITDRNEWLALFTTLMFTAALITLVPLALATRQAIEAGSLLPTWGRAGPGSVTLRSDPGALVIVATALGLGTLTSIYSGRYLSRDPRHKLYYPLLLLMMTGLCGTVLAADLFNLYLFCELMSIAAYVLVAFRRHTRTAIEAGFKYLVMGSVGTLLFLVGVALVYRERGTIALPPVTLAPAAPLGIWSRVGLTFFLVGLGVKSALVPVHTWLPDAHGRAPSSISALLSGIIIQSALYALLKVCLGIGMSPSALGGVLIAVSLANMTLGNTIALAQTYTKRLLGYSTIAQVGYMAFGIGVGLRYGLPEAVQAGFFLLVAHAVMKALAFLSKGVCHFHLNTTTIAELRGTALQLPLVAVTFSVALGGLAGVPPLAGFISKWFILGQALEPGEPLAYVGLAIFLLNSLVALGYYLPLIAQLFATSDPAATGPTERIRISRWMAIPLIAGGALVIAIGLSPGPWWSWLGDVGPYLLGR